MDKDKNQGTVNEESKEINQDGEYSKLIEHFKKVLGNLVKDIKISKKLTSSISCLTVGDSGMDMYTERLLMEQRRFSSPLSKVLEINPKHPIIQRINDDLQSENANSIIDNDQLIKLVFDQACIMEGQPLPDAVEFSKRINDVLEKVLSGTGIENKATIEEIKPSKPKPSAKKKSN